MKYSIPWLAIALLATTLHAGGGPRPPIEESEIAAVTAAAKAMAPAKPEKARQVLLFTAAEPRHFATIATARVLEILGHRTASYQTTTTGDAAMFDIENLKHYDAIGFINTAGDPLLPAGQDRKANLERRDTLRKNILDFVSGGKGVIAIHAAPVAFEDWPEYGQLIGARYAGRPFNRAVIKVEDPDHPLLKNFGPGFEVKDEIAAFREPFSRKNCRVLLSVDWDKSRLYGGPRYDHDYALSWIKPYGQGRVFYFALGHQKETLINKQILRHLLDGVQYALGDLKADATPTAAKK